MGKPVILIGDCRERLRGLPDQSVHCVVTSPPYWGLRDYGVEGQLGMEPTFQEHVAVMADLFDEVRRVLRDDGTLWLNYGDTYASSVNGRSAADTKASGNDDRTFRDKPFSTVQGVLKTKDMCGIPWRVAFALQERGWYLRQDIIWHKPNPMPESVSDRCTKAHEYLFLLAKQPRYYFDADAIAEETVYQPLSEDENSHRGSSFDKGKTAAHQLGRASAKPRRSSRTKHDFSDERKRNGDDGMAASFRAIRETRNKRSVWTVPTQAFSEAHFATFPPALIEPCILAGCPVGGIVLDPFGGAGTTGLVADRLQRESILIELNEEYAEIARRRIDEDRGGLLDQMENAHSPVHGDA